MIPVKSIDITRAEGPIGECDQTITVATFSEASRVFARIAETAPNTGGYDKTDFVVTFADGQTYAGRADIQRGHVGGYDLAQHIRSFLGYLAGTVRPEHVKLEDWEFLKRSNAFHHPEAAEFLAKYDLTFDGTPPVKLKLERPAREEPKPDHFEGSKYRATQDLRITEVAKLIRADLKAEFPGIKFSVTCGSGHNAIDVVIKSLPAGMVVRNPRYIASSGDPETCFHQTREAMDFEKRVEAVVNAYNFDRSDIQSDYFNVRFYESVRFSDECRNPPKPVETVREFGGGPPQEGVRFDSRPVLTPSDCVPLEPFPSLTPIPAKPSTEPQPALGVRSSQSDFLAACGVEE